MTQNILVKPVNAQPLFSLNMPGVDELFPGFAAGDFAVLYGSPSVISLLHSYVSEHNYQRSLEV